MQEWLSVKIHPRFHHLKKLVTQISIKSGTLFDADYESEVRLTRFCFIDFWQRSKVCIFWKLPFFGRFTPMHGVPATDELAQ